MSQSKPRRDGGADTRSGPAPATGPPRTWREMRERTVRLLIERTGEDVGAWNRRIAEPDDLDDEALAVLRRAYEANT